MADTTKKRVEVEIGARDNTRGAFASLEGRLDAVKRKFGRRGLFGDLGELLVGGGALGGVSYLFNTLATGVNGITEAVAGLKDGTKQASDVLRSAIGAVPVLGTFVGSLTDLTLELFRESTVELNKARQEYLAFRKEIEQAEQKGAGIVNSLRKEIVTDTSARFGTLEQRLAIIDADLEARQAQLDKLRAEAQETLRLTGDPAATLAVDEASIAANNAADRAKESALTGFRNQLEQSILRTRFDLQEAAAQRELDTNKRNSDAALFAESVREAILRTRFEIQETPYTNRAAFPGFATLNDTGGTGANDAARESIRARFEAESLEVQKESRNALVSIDKQIQQSNAVLLGVFR